MDNEIYARHDRSMKNITIGALLKEVSSYSTCSGLTHRIEPTASIEHYVPRKIDLSAMKDGTPTSGTKYYRSRDCHVISTDAQCKSCERLEKKEEKENEKKQKIIDTPAHKFAPLSTTHPNRNRLALLEERKTNKDLAAENETLKRMLSEIESKGVEVNQKGLRDEFHEIMEQNKNIRKRCKYSSKRLSGN